MCKELKENALCMSMLEYHASLFLTHELGKGSE